MQDVQIQVHSGNHEESSGDENSQEQVSSLSSIKPQDIPYYVKTINKFNNQIQDAVLEDKIRKILLEMKEKNIRKVPG